MGYLHALITLLVAVVYLLIGVILTPIHWCLKKISPKTGLRFAEHYAQFGLGLIRVVAGVRVNVIGRENLPNGEPVLYVANHRSMFDILVLVPLFKGSYGIVAKKELEKVPLLRYWMRQVHCIFLDRTDIKAGVQMVTDAVSYLKEGTSMLIFPEGTRGHEEGKLLPMHGGSFKIAIKAGKPVVPVTIIGTGDIMEDHFPRLKAKKVTVVIGAPIPTDGMPIADRKALPAKCEAMMQENLNQYGAR